MTDLIDRAADTALPAGKRRPRVSRVVRRQHFLAAAGAVFATRGYHATTVDDVCRRAGFSKPVLYDYFPSKLDLYLEVLQSHLEALMSSVRAALCSTTDNQQRVRAAVQAYFDFVDDEVEGFRMVFESSVVDEPSVQWQIDRAKEACVDAVFDVVAHDSGLDPQRARILAVGLVGVSEFTARHWLQTARPVPKNEAVDMTVALCWGGLSRVPLSATP
ncbi:TetR/AcrR family transcriptional regulator [Nocardia miyunensis]|uniref:TetR/AcrR family transcriptional regulator n=1 Tax=Nocardia miyunensis TaxID=282684 RepID=UPI00083535E0|nr:TetR/AcrR family transcriptional regulator [Nocardia miyunensis]